ncbi:Extracellular solute-binding protein, family 3 [Niveomyces insectorum RCEF 264]|uniref:Extracellular solute-binding protein, family 3 n=1 Tax=Niveomyces insectorum RCEF 264 TaxID=1081102 RepID=A0A167NFV0_9HYPO|nr:Extracellular solute-binding protein, family 3 [Niveomyces insectorum RCEF 264]
MATAPLRVGYVPEHFSTPIYFAQKYFGLDAELIPYPSGTGHMIKALRTGDIDIGIGLTEGWVAGLGKEEPEKGGYKIVGTYVETPLCWAVSTGANRTDVTSVESLRGSKIGVSRIGSGSFVIGFVLADQQGWLTEATTQPFADTVVLDTFKNLRNAVNSGDADFFMWEHFTSKKYYDNGEIKKVGEIYTPWSSWKIVASTRLVSQTETSDGRLDDLFAKLDRGVAHFNANPEEAVKYISTSLDYSEADARAWLETVRFPATTKGVRAETIDNCIDVLQKAGVLVKGKGPASTEMIAGGK